MNNYVKAFFGIMSVAPVLFLIGMSISFGLFLVFPQPFISNVNFANVLTAIGSLLILSGTALAFSAQRVSRVVTRPDYKATCPDLMQGPYAHTRHPGSLSLIMMFFGFALLVNSLVMMIVAGGIFILLTLIFVPAQEKVIAELCPDAYKEYRSKVRMWL